MDFGVASVRAPVGLRPDGRDPTRRWRCAARKARINSIQKGPQPSRGRIRGARGPQTTPSGHSRSGGVARAEGMAGGALRSGSGDQNGVGAA